MKTNKTYKYQYQEEPIVLPAKELKDGIYVSYPKGSRIYLLYTEITIQGNHKNTLKGDGIKFIVCRGALGNDITPISEDTELLWINPETDNWYTDSHPTYKTLNVK